jgi:glycerophosphoryl diester phosphodiesterase
VEAPLAWLGKRARPLVLAHRGASREAPENTLAAFRLAREGGADGIELDVMCCRSGEVVVFHDDDLRRLAGRPERVVDLTLAELVEIDLGGGERIPTLGQAFQAAGPCLLVNVELKISTLAGTRALAAATARELERARATDRVLVSSFNPVALACIGRASPGIPLGLLYERAQALPLRQAWAAPLLQAAAVHPEAALCDPLVVAGWHRRGYAVHTRTVDDPREVAALARAGVDAIITNLPRRARAVLAGLDSPSAGLET